ncbi:hypothetical protein [Spiroplasma endosymbiont of Labia minor]|uniref:hypothetical protein n=1 Tax=Spiroplasma endosymbiont of Labia minor TaxID=3066305 RepID=UPI0030D14120
MINNYSDELFDEVYGVSDNQQELVDLYSTASVYYKLYLYKINSFSGRNLNKHNLIKVALNRTTLVVTDIDDYVEIDAVNNNELGIINLTQIYDTQQTQNSIFKSVAPQSYTFQYCSDNTVVSGAPEKVVDFLDEENLYFYTFNQKLTNDNFDDVDKFIILTMTPPQNLHLSILRYSFEAINIDDWAQQARVHPLKILNANPDMTKQKIKAITVKSPDGTFLTSIKALEQNGARPPLFPDKNTFLFVRQMFPYQTSPTVELLDFWNSNQIVGFKEIFDYLDSQNVKYNEEFSLGKFLELGDVIEGGKDGITISGITELTINEMAVKYDYSSRTFPNGSPTRPESKDALLTDFKLTTDNNSSSKFNISVKPGEVNGFENKSVGVDIPTGWPANSIVTHTADNFVVKNPINITYTRGVLFDKTEFYQLIIDMLNFSYHAKNNFRGAIDLDKNTNQEIIKNIDIYKLRDEAVKAGDVVTAISNRFDLWVNTHPELLKTAENRNILKRGKWVISALSNHIISNYSYNQGKSDDSKLILPFGLELTNTPDIKDPNEIPTIPYATLTVKLISSYGNFSETNFEFDNVSSISVSKKYILASNIMAFPEIDNQIETSAIPSTIPGEVKLSNGEYSKYNVFKTRFSNEYLLNQYGNGNIDYLRINDISLEGRFVFDIEENKLFNLAELLFTGLNLVGEWKISFEMQLSNIEFNLKIGDETNDTNGQFMLNF